MNENKNMTTCNDCGAEVSVNADKCLNCGAHRVSAKVSTMYVYFFGAIAPVIVGLFAMLPNITNKAIDVKFYGIFVMVGMFLLARKFNRKLKKEQDLSPKDVTSSFWVILLMFPTYIVFGLALTTAFIGLEQIYGIGLNEWFVLVALLYILFYIPMLKFNKYI